MIRLFQIISLIILLCTIVLEAQPSLGPGTKGVVYRINRKSDADTTLEATGIVFKENGNLFLITNLHVVNPSPGDYGDSLIIYLNRNLPNNDVLSGPKTITVFFSVDSSNFVFYPLCDSVDLALIALREENTRHEQYDSINSLATSTLISIDKIKMIANTNPIVTVVGYPSKYKQLIERTPEYVWGNLASIGDRLIQFDAPIWPGNSGSPLIARVEKKYFLIGVVCSYNPVGEIAYAIPTSNIKVCFNQYFEMIKLKK